MYTEIYNMLLTHSKRYPKMEIADYLKLLYQAYYGPFHFQGNPNKEKIKMRLDDELEHLNQAFELIEDIGNNYVRVHLGLIKANKLSSDIVAEAFLKSMNDDLDLVKAENLFLDGIDQLKDFLLSIQEEAVAKQSILKIDEYLQQGIRPIHHSETFREYYSPHYRVISKKYLIDK